MTSSMGKFPYQINFLSKMKSPHNIDLNPLHCLINLECCIKVNGN